MRPLLVVLHVFVFALSGLAVEAAAQTATPQTVEVRLRDGSRIYGYVISEDQAALTIKTVAGADLTVQRNQVEAVKPVSGSVVGAEFWLDDAVDSKLFLGPTGRALKRGQAYFAIDSVVLPVVQIGVTDRFSVGFGAPLYGLLKTAWITPKLQLYRSDRLAVSSGVLHFVVPDFGLGGYGYTVATVGTANGAVTFGGGVLYGRDGDRTATTPMFTIGGERRMSRRSKLITENYVFDGGVITSFGTRLIRDRTSWELGVLVPIVRGGSLPGLFFNFVMHDRPGRVTR